MESDGKLFKYKLEVTRRNYRANMGNLGGIRSAYQIRANKSDHKRFDWRRE